MRKGFLGSVAALAVGAGTAWAQPGALPGPGAGPGVIPGPAAPGAPAPGKNPAPIAPSMIGAGPVAPQPPIGGPQQWGGFPSTAIPGNAGFSPEAVIMPPGNFGPAYDPLGLGPVGGFGPPPGPMYPVPGPYGQQTWQPAPPMPSVFGPGDPSDPDGGKHGIGNRLLNRDLGYGRAPHFWGEFEVLLWFTKGQPVRYPLLTSSAPSDAGMPFAPSTTVLVGGRELGYNLIGGTRTTFGFFGDEDRRFGFQTSVFQLERVSNIQKFGNLNLESGLPVLARPFIDTAGVQNTIVLSSPDFGKAVAEVGTNTETWGIEAEGIWNIYRSEPGCRRVWSLDFLLGYRYIFMKEELWISSRSELDSLIALPQFQQGPFGTIRQVQSIAGVAQTTFGQVAVGAPAVIEIRDRFTVTNQFNGAVVGLTASGRYGMLTTTLTGKVAVGNMHERVNVFGGSAFFDATGRSGSLASTLGSFNVNAGGGSGAAFGGVLANAGNIGVYIHDRFTYIPEGTFNVGIALTKGLTGFVGANFIYFPNVVRPGYIASPFVSSAAIPASSNYGAAGAPRTPPIRIAETDHWIGGVNIGLMLRY